MYKTAIIRYESSLNDKYATWNICLEHCLITKQFEKKTSLYYNNNRNYFRGRSQTAWGITETVTTGLGSLLAIDKFVHVFVCLIVIIITSSSLLRLPRHGVINIDVSDI